MNNLFKSVFLLVTILLVGFSFVSTASVSGHHKLDHIQGTNDTVNESVCPGGDNAWVNDWYKDQNSAFGVTVDSNYEIDQVCVKGGSDNSPNGYLLNFNSNGQQECIIVSGIGSQSASAVHNGSAENVCAGISHASFHRVLKSTPEVCEDQSANNYGEEEECEYDEEVCEDDSANNYGQEGVCEYDEDVCEDRTATNYGEAESCDYEDEPVCDEDQAVSYDDNGIKICIDCPGGGDCEVIIGGTPTPTPTEAPTPTATPGATVTPTPTNSPSNGGDNNNNDNGGVGGDTTSEKQGEVLGVNTLPQTGNFASTLATIEQALGLAFVTLGAMIYGKKKSSKKSK